MTVAGYYDDDQKFCILEELSLPALEELSFEIVSEQTSNIPPRPSYTPQLKSLIFRSRPPLKSLHISGNGCLGPIAITECLPLLPLLSYLKVEHIVRELNGIADALTWPVHPSDEDLPPRVCPQLKEIYFGYRDPWQLDRLPPELVIKMILSRSVSRESSLSHVTVLECKESEILADPRLVDCIANGLEFEGEKEWGMGSPAGSESSDGDSE
ncbi:hypothetical protein BD410DRAFT_842428 [Rickenella mellea]|uniref:F-box domain-containing protein n=1 Tax=Rickenella mellea TaxID=50990 RepID=A0A4Y7PVS8_9AGAM|nr:hypothetical protein BD410DRAFT_842428 [Rickenella mellea]